MPRSAKWCAASSNIWEACSRAFEGMPPTFREVPPLRLTLFHDGRLQAELRGADGAHIAAGAGSDDDEIVGHSSPTPCQGRPRTGPRVNPVLSIQGPQPFSSRSSGHAGNDVKQKV